MGYGKRLKEVLDERGMSVMEFSRRTEVSSQTIYSIIKRDSSIRFDFALRFANVLNVDISEFCKQNPYDEGEVMPSLQSGLDGWLDDGRVSRYIKYRMTPLMQMIGKDDLDKIDQLLTGFYSLNEEGRKQLFTQLAMIMNMYTDPMREEEIKTIGTVQEN